MRSLTAMTFPSVSPLARLSVLLLAAGVLSACNLAPVYQRPGAPVPTTFDSASSTNAPAEFTAQPVEAADWALLP